MRAWMNGDLLTDPTGAVLGVTDHGFTVGDGVFESIKTLDGVRSPSPVTSTGWPAPRPVWGSTPPTRLPCAAASRRCWRDRRPARSAADHLHGRPGADGLGTRRRPGHPGRGVLRDRADRGVDRGGHRALDAQRARGDGGPQDHVVRRERHRARPRPGQGGTEAIFANTAGHLCEGTGSNVFYVVDGELRTPTLASGCLAGVTRALVLEWCGGREVDEPLEVAQAADEAFLVSTTRDVQAISRWDGRELPAPGPVTAECAATWRRREAERIDP